MEKKIKQQQKSTNSLQNLTREKLIIIHSQTFIDGFEVTESFVFGMILHFSFKLKLRVDQLNSTVNAMKQKGTNGELKIKMAILNTERCLH